MHRKSFYIAFLGNVRYDSRCRNLIDSLKKREYEVSAVSFDYRDAAFRKVTGEVSIYPLTKRYSSIYFYLKFLFILFFKTVRTRADHYLAADVYTLPVLALFSKIRKIPLYYDSREVYTEIAALSGRSKVQAVITWIERRFIHAARGVIVTGSMDGELLKKLYAIPDPILLRNLPVMQKISNPVNLRERFGVGANTLLMVYQGVVLHGRGLRLLYDAMLKVSGTALVVIGDGEQRCNYQNLAKSMGLNKRVFFTGMIDQRELLSYTAGGDLGIALIERLSLSYYYALPNKLFEYIMAGIPVVSSNFPQMKEIVETYKAGFTIDPEKPEQLTELLTQLADTRESLGSFTLALRKASEELHWEADCGRFLAMLES